MKTFREFITEASEEHVLYVNGSNELWLQHAEGSGQTIQLPDIKRYVTDKKGDKNYDSLVPKIAKWANKAKAIKKQANSKLFKIPRYELKTQLGNTKDIWGGTQKPVGYLYMNVDTNEAMTVINIFDNKNEAMAWIKSLA